VGNLLIRQIQSHEVETQYPYFQRLMMARKDGVSQIIEACVTVGTLVALTGGFRVIKAALDDVFGLTRWAFDAIWPAQFADGLITLHIIDEILDIDLHGWTPVRDRRMECHQCTPSSNSTTPESNKSDSDKVCDVVWQKGQFSWTEDGKSDRMTDLDAISKAVDVALAASRGKIKDPTGGALHFYAHDKAKPYWSRAGYRLVVGEHTFVRLVRR
jgi:Cell Wall Hydrolase